MPPTAPTAFFLTLLASLAPLPLATSALGQDGTPPALPPFAEAPGAVPAVDPFVHILPGSLPEETSPEAEQLWFALCAATLAPGVERRPIQTFDLSFEVLTRRGVETKNGNLRHRFLAPTFVRTMLESGNEQGRGPAGYWGRFPAGKSEQEVVRYDGRTYEEDRWSIDQTLAISRNFVSLADPASLRVIHLERLTDAPLDEIVPALRARARSLQWLEIVSPDFGLPTRTQLPANVQQVYRVRIGCDATTSAPVLVSIQPRDAVLRATDLPADQSFEFDGFLIELRGSVELDGYRLPQEIYHHPYRVRKPTGSRQVVAEFSPKPEQEFWLLSAQCTLAPELEPDDFRP